MHEGIKPIVDGETALCGDWCDYIQESRGVDGECQWFCEISKEECDSCIPWYQNRIEELLAKIDKYKVGLKKSEAICRQCKDTIDHSKARN